MISKLVIVLISSFIAAIAPCFAEPVLHTDMVSVFSKRTDFRDEVRYEVSLDNKKEDQQKIRNPRELYIEPFAPSSYYYRQQDPPSNYWYYRW